MSCERWQGAGLLTSQASDCAGALAASTVGRVVSVAAVNETLAGFGSMMLPKSSVTPVMTRTYPVPLVAPPSVNVAWSATQLTLLKPRPDGFPSAFVVV